MTTSVFNRSKSGAPELILVVAVDVSSYMDQELCAPESNARLNNGTQPENNSQMVDQQQREKILVQSAEHFKAFIGAVQDYAIFSLNDDGKIQSWNEGVEAVLGYEKDDFLGQKFGILFSFEAQADLIPERELKNVGKNKVSIYEGLLIRKDGSTFQGIVTVSAVHDTQKTIEGFSVIIRDITEKKEAEETIRYQAFHDTLTGLANREALYDRFEMVRSNAQRHGQKFALVFLDIDRFKVINDTLGHSVGDIILREIADRLTRAVRQNDVIARLGGDEFVLMLTEITNLQDVTAAVGKIIHSFNDVVRVQNRSLHISASVGIAVYPEDGTDIHALLKNSDIALYRAKDAGRNRYRFYNYSMNLESDERLSLEQDLRSAIENEQFQVAYQPFVDVATNTVVGVEALVRWNHPTLGILYPSDFIPISEDTGMIIPLGKWILKSACQQGKRWADAGRPLTVSVNLSARQFGEEDIVEAIETILIETEFPPHLLELEITESVAMENVARTTSKLGSLKEKGIAIAIDDFGTGYSSLSYLKRFPVHKLKIDKSFIMHAMNNPQDFAIVRAIISMGHSLGLVVCAEGVEDQKLLELLASMDCDISQGYFISKPLYIKEFTAWFQKVV